MLIMFWAGIFLFGVTVGFCWGCRFSFHINEQLREKNELEWKLKSGYDVDDF